MVTVATGRLWLISDRDRNSFLSHHILTSAGANTTSNAKCTRSSFLEQEYNFSLPSSVKIQNVQGFTFLSPVYLHGMLLTQRGTVNLEP